MKLRSFIKLLTCDILKSNIIILCAGLERKDYGIDIGRKDIQIAFAG